MSVGNIPGTCVPGTEAYESAFALFRSMIKAADGLSLGQVASVTGLECSTVQNWVKRGFVPHPVRKKYYEKQFVRILLISALKDSMKLENIGEIMSKVNGDVEDESDDAIPDVILYDGMCRSIGEVEKGKVTRENVEKAVLSVLSDYKEPFAGAKRRVCTALCTMVLAYESAKLKRESEIMFSQLMKG